MLTVAHLLVRVPDLAPVTLAIFLADHAETDAEGASLAILALASGAAITCGLKDGRTVHLERAGLFVVGTVVPGYGDPQREACLDAIGCRMGDRTVPGGTIDAWLAPLPTAALAAVIAAPAVEWPERLTAALGRARRGAAVAEMQDLHRADRAGLAAGPVAEGALMAWATCIRARELIAAGRAGEALSTLRAFTRLSSGLPCAVEARFAARLDRLHAEAEAARSRQLADEVA